MSVEGKTRSVGVDPAHERLQAQEALIRELADALNVSPAALQPTEFSSVLSLVQTALLRKDFELRDDMARAAIAIFEGHGQYLNAFRICGDVSVVGLPYEGRGADWVLNLYKIAMSAGKYEDAYCIARDMFKVMSPRPNKIPAINWLPYERNAFEAYAQGILNSNPSEILLSHLDAILMRNGYWGYSGSDPSPLCREVAEKLLAYDRQHLRPEAAYTHAVLAGLTLEEALAIRDEIHEQRRLLNRLRRGARAVLDLFGAVGEV